MPKGRSPQYVNKIKEKLTMKKIFFFLMAFAAVAFAACSGDDEQTIDDNIIRLSSNIGASQGVTRATLTDAEAQNTQFASSKSVFVEVYKYNGSTAYTTGNYTTSNTSGAMTGSLFYPADGSNIDICAYYPSTISSSSTSFTVGATQTSAANYQSYDLMYATKLTNKAKGSSHALTFNHALTKIIVNLQAGNGVTDSDLTTHVTALKLKSLKPTAGFAISGGAVGTITASGIAADVDILGTTKPGNHCAIIVPQQKTSGAFIEVTYKGNTYTYSLASNTTFEKGKVYTYNITVNATGISLSSNSINNWTSTTAVNGSVTL